MLLILVISILSACGSEGEETKQTQTEQTEKKEEKEEKKPINYKLEIGETLEFEEFTVEILQVKVKEKKGDLLADIKFDWTNRDYNYGYPEKTLYTTTFFEVKQGDAVLNEINDYWNVENKGFSPVFDTVNLNESRRINLTYKLKDNETPIDLYFTPTTETEDTKKFTIQLKK